MCPQVPTASVAPGDILCVMPGERIPVDAVVLAGRSVTDEAMLTGEAALVPKTAGDKVRAPLLVSLVNGVLLLRGAQASAPLASYGMYRLLRYISDGLLLPGKSLLNAKFMSDTTRYLAVITLLYSILLHQLCNLASSFHQGMAGTVNCEESLLSRRTPGPYWCDVLMWH